MRTFLADTLEAVVDSEADIPVSRVWLSDEKNLGSSYLQFEKQTAPDAQSLALGFDFPHIEICDQGYSGYNLVDQVVCSSRTLTVHFNGKGRRALQAETYQIQLDSNLDLRRMTEIMHAIFGEKFVLLNFA